MYIIIYINNYYNYIHLFKAFANIIIYNYNIYIIIYIRGKLGELRKN